MLLSEIVERMAKVIECKHPGVDPFSLEIDLIDEGWYELKFKFRVDANEEVDTFDELSVIKLFGGWDYVHK